MFGKIQLEQFAGAAGMPQKAQSAWTAIFENPEFTGAKFKPLLYCAKQEVHGTNYFYVAERTIPYRYEIRNLVLLAIWEHDGEYDFDEASVKEIL